MIPGNMKKSTWIRTYCKFNHETLMWWWPDNIRHCTHEHLQYLERNKK